MRRYARGGFAISDDTLLDRRTGAVRSVQSARLEVPDSALEGVWTPEGLERLARTYWRFLARITLGIAHVHYGQHSRSVVLVAPALRLFTFAPPLYEMAPDRGLVRWQIRSGLLVSRRAGCTGGNGHLELEVLRQPSTQPGFSVLQIKVEVANFYPAIAFALSRKLYEVTQSRIHVIVTRAFLRSLARSARHGQPQLAMSKVGRLSAR